MKRAKPLDWAEEKAIIVVWVVLMTVIFIFSHGGK